ncbi:MAG: DinB family protein [Chitinophagaceae bacterium]
MDKHKLMSDLELSTLELLQYISDFRIELFNLSSEDKRWSAAQIAEHLLILEVIANKALAGKTISTNRPPDEKINLIKTAMSDMNTKRIAPEIVTPSAELKDPKQMIEEIKTQRALLKKAIGEMDMTEACVSFKHPGLGTLTRYEWVYFTIFHTQRHLKQLQEVKNSLTTL